MKMPIKEFAQLAGVSVRTLHYYDQIGLLRPAVVDAQTGYRYYDEASLLRMQEILFYRELDFPLKSIAEILASPHYNKEEALEEQRKLLTLKKERLERLIGAIDGALKGENVMKAFDNSKMEQYMEQAKARWSKTEAWQEYEKKSAGRTAQTEKDLGEQLMEFFVHFGALRDEEPDSEPVQQVVVALQQFITDHYYTCTKEILRNLGQMYTAIGSMKDNIDARGGAGTAELAARAIEIYCSK
jgi:DNA-binding transcriptional MerR regulator